MNKDDEQILVVPSEIIFAREKWQGLKTDNLDYYLELIKNNCQFKRRGDMENDPSFQQIIPYIVFNFKDKYFVYKYLPKAGEQRLVDTYQLGVGGHINEEDSAGNKGAFKLIENKPESLIQGNADVLEIGMMREWEEEVDFKGKLLEKKLIGILNDDSRPVEAVHLGLVYSFTGDSPEIFVKETEKMEGKLVALEEIGKHIEGNPGVWVQIVYRYLSKTKISGDFSKKYIATLKDYQEFCKTVAREFDDPEKEIMTWGLGISGEAGDVAGCIKKTYSHGNDQKAGIKENLGDTLWYVAAICNFFGWNMEDILNENAEKLKIRYSAGVFTEKDAAKRERIDWNEKATRKNE